MKPGKPKKWPGHTWWEFGTQRCSEATAGRPSHRPAAPQHKRREAAPQQPAHRLHASHVTTTPAPALFYVPTALSSAVRGAATTPQRAALPAPRTAPGGTCSAHSRTRPRFPTSSRLCRDPTAAGWQSLPPSLALVPRPPQFHGSATPTTVPVAAPWARHWPPPTPGPGRQHIPGRGSVHASSRGAGAQLRGYAIGSAAPAENGTERNRTGPSPRPTQRRPLLPGPRRAGGGGEEEEKEEARSRPSGPQPASNPMAAAPRTRRGGPGRAGPRRHWARGGDCAVTAPTASPPPGPIRRNDPAGIRATPERRAAVPALRPRLYSGQGKGLRDVEAEVRVRWEKRAQVEPLCRNRFCTESTPRLVRAPVSTAHGVLEWGLCTSLRSPSSTITFSFGKGERRSGFWGLTAP